jgi:hypothetical protein
VFLAGDDNYLPMTFDREPLALTIEVKGLDGRVLDRQRYRGRTTGPQ